MTQETGLTVATEGEPIVVFHADPAMLAAALNFAEQAKAIVISDQQSYQGGNAMLREVATLAASIEKDRKAKKAPILAAGKALDAEYANADRALREARAAIEQAGSKWQREQSARRQEAARIAFEAQEKERRRLEMLAEKAADRGDTVKAQQFEDRAIAIAETPPPAPAPMPEAEGITRRAVWQFEITDPSALPREYLIPDEPSIRKVVQALKGRTNIPGVRVWEGEQTVVRKVAP